MLKSFLQVMQNMIGIHRHPLLGMDCCNAPLVGLDVEVTMVHRMPYGLMFTGPGCKSYLSEKALPPHLQIQLSFYCLNIE